MPKKPAPLPSSGTSFSLQQFNLLFPPTYAVKAEGGGAPVTVAVKQEKSARAAEDNGAGDERRMKKKKRALAATHMDEDDGHMDSDSIVEREVSKKEEEKKKKKRSSLFNMLELFRYGDGSIFLYLLQHVENKILLFRSCAVLRKFQIGASNNEFYARIVCGLGSWNPVVGSLTTRGFKDYMKMEPNSKDVVWNHRISNAKDAKAFNPCVVSHINVREKPLNSFMECGDLRSPNLNRDILAYLFDSGCEIRKYGVHRIRFIENVDKEGVPYFILVMSLVCNFSQVTTDNPKFAKLLADNSPVVGDVAGEDTCWIVDFKVRINKTGPLTLDFVSLGPRHKSMRRLVSPLTGDIWTQYGMLMPGSWNFKLSTPNGIRFANAMERMLAGVSYPPLGKRQVQYCVPLGNVKGDRFDDFQAGTMLSVVVAHADHPFSYADDPGRHSYAMLLLIHKYTADNDVDVQVLRMSHGVLIPFIVDGRPVVLESLYDQDTIHSSQQVWFLDYSCEMQKFRSESNILINVLFSPGIIENFRCIVENYRKKSSYLGDDESVLEILLRSDNGVVNGVLEMADLDQKRIRELLKFDNNAKTSDRLIALLWSRTDGFRQIRFVKQLMNEIIRDIHRVLDVILEYASERQNRFHQESAFKKHIKMLVEAEDMSIGSAHYFGFRFEQFFGSSLDPAFEKFLGMLRECVPLSDFYLACEVLSNPENEYKTGVMNRAVECLRWSLDHFKPEGGQRLDISEKCKLRVALVLSAHYKGFNVRWADYFGLNDMKMSSMIVEGMKPSLSKFFTDFKDLVRRAESLFVLGSQVKKVLEKEELERNGSGAGGGQQDTADGGSAGGVKGASLPLDLGTVLDTRTAASISVVEAMSIVERIKAISDDYSKPAFPPP